MVKNTFEINNLLPLEKNILRVLHEKTTPLNAFQLYRQFAGDIISGQLTGQPESVILELSPHLGVGLASKNVDWLHMKKNDFVNVLWIITHKKGKDKNGNFHEESKWHRREAIPRYATVRSWLLRMVKKHWIKTRQVGKTEADCVFSLDEKVKKIIDESPANALWPEVKEPTKEFKGVLPKS